MKRRSSAAAAVGILLLFSFGMVPVAVQAQAGRTIAVRAGLLIDGSGAAPIEDVVILIRGDRIAAVGRDVRIPKGATVVDLSDMTVLPGFIDAHTHVTGLVVGEKGWDDALVRASTATQALVGAWHARKTIDGGFTTVRNVGAGGFADVALRNAINDGYVMGPRMQVAAHALGITGGHCDVNGYVPGVMGGEPGIREGIANGRDEIFASIRYQVKYGADVIKICATGGVLSVGDSVGVQQYTDEELAAVVEAARMVERRVAAHAHGNAGIKAAVRAGVNSVEHGSILDDEAIQLMLEHGTYLVPTLMAAEAVEKLVAEGKLTGQRADKATWLSPIMRKSFRKAVAAGVRIALGTDAGVMSHGRNAHEFTLMVKNGMTPMQAIVAGTSAAADLLGWQDRIGLVEPGHFADMVAVRGNPLSDITLLEHVQLVMKGGNVVKRPKT